MLFSDSVKKIMSLNLSFSLESSSKGDKPHNGASSLRATSGSTRKTSFDNTFWDLMAVSVRWISLVIGGLITKKEELKGCEKLPQFNVRRL